MRKEDGSPGPPAGPHRLSRPAGPSVAGGPAPRLALPLLGAGHAAAAPRRSPARRPPPPPLPLALPAPSPHVWVTSKFREKAAWWLPERRRDSAAQWPPPGRAGGRAKHRDGRFLFLRGGRAPPTPRARRPPPQILLEN